MRSHSPTSDPTLRPSLADQLNALVRRTAQAVAWLTLVLIGVILAQVVLRYGFHHGLVALEESMWHLYALVCLFGMAYGVTNDSHIRVDLLQGALPPRARHLVALVLRELGGDELIESALTDLGLGPHGLVLFVLAVVFLLGFFLDWIEISLIVLPLLGPVIGALELGVDGFGQVDNPELVWFALLVAVTLQTSFLTPPVGFALFYLKGVCPPPIRLLEIYRGVLPFVLLQLLGLALVFLFPALTTWLPAVAYGT
jgi:TRAP-type mannitol/chloroaromatic compound transport system permease large subunit